MGHLTSDLYQRLPTPGRSLAASARGLQLRLTRYDRQLEDRVEAAVDREHWSPTQWGRARSMEIEAILDSARSAPYYAPILAGMSHAELGQLPVTPKSAVRDSPSAFWSASAAGGRLVEESTSGTSGSPLSLRFTREAVRQWFALVETRMRRWHGLSVSDRWAMFGGQLVVPVRRSDPPFWVHNRPMHQLYVSTHHLSRVNAPAIAHELTRFRPKYLLGYPSSMALLSRYALEDGLRLPEVAVVLSNAETLTDAQRDVIGAAFRAPVRNTYGMAEAVAGGSECDHGTMHLWPEVGIVEVAGTNGDVIDTPGATGPLVLTGLLNRAMPLLRYEVGDRGCVPTASSCRCGRTLPVLGPIEGRSTDFVVTPDGRHVFWINPVFRDLPIAEAQLVQHAVGEVEVRVVPTSAWAADVADVLIDRLAARLGLEMVIRVSVVDAIERDPSGKFRAIVSHVEGDGPFG